MLTPRPLLRHPLTRLAGILALALSASAASTAALAALTGA